MKLYGGARALLYPVQAREPFGLVLAEAMACGTPVAALDRGAVREVVDDGVTGLVFDDLEEMIHGLPRVLALDRRRVREQRGRPVRRRRMVDEYVAVYTPDRRGSPCADASAAPSRWPDRARASSRTPTTSRWRAAGRWPGSPTPAAASS